MPDPIVQEVKKRRFTKKDMDYVTDFVKDTYEHRKNHKHRKAFEEIWKAVDRQIKLESNSVSERDPKSTDARDDWHSEIELGLLSKATEILTADAMRLGFPINREMFLVHQDLRNGTKPIDQKDQEYSDKRLRSFMSQQHIDFGFKERVKLSLKEIFHHGSMCAEMVDKRLTTIHKGKGIQQLNAPVWQPHSMWNTFPDPSQSIIGTNLFYEGSMLLRTFISKDAALRKKDWVNKDKIRLIDKPKTKDLEVIKYYGDINIPRAKGGDIYLPNMEIEVLEDIFVSGKASPYPFPRIIYTGYERFDVTNAYYLSPLMKMSPMQTFTSHAINKFIDWGDLTVEPPIYYNMHNPEMAATGGPEMKPGSKTGVTGPADFNEVRVGDGSPLLEGIRFGVQQIEENTGVDANRAGVAAGTEQTATEIKSNNVRGELRMSDFVGMFEQQGILPSLYMQHEMNKNSLDKRGYLFYNDRPGAADFDVMNRKDLPDNVVFDVTASRGVIGEIQRGAAVMEVTRFLKEQEGLKDITRDDEIAVMLYSDAGVKNPEKILKINDSDNPPDPQVVALQTQLEQAVAAAEEVQAEFQKQIQELEKKSADLETSNNKLEISVKEKELEVQKAQTETTIEKQERRSAENELRIVKQVSMSQSNLFGLVEKTRNAAGENIKLDENGKPQKVSQKPKSAAAPKPRNAPAPIVIPEKEDTPKVVQLRPNDTGGFTGEIEPMDGKGEKQIIQLQPTEDGTFSGTISSEDGDIEIEINKNQSGGYVATSIPS